MPAYVALLRGINVGGKHSLPMVKVRAVFEASGASNVATYIQSGNVVFNATKISAATLASALDKAAGFAVPVVLRTAKDFKTVITSNPWATETMHCAFLPAKPLKAALAKLAAIDHEALAPSRVVQLGQELYFDLPEGIGRDKLAATVLRAFPDATTRNWRTVLTLQEMLESL
jgi:uncharacterized protein (DUF1697 family)